MPNIDGIVSGFDTTGLINAILEVERTPQRAMMANQDQASDRLEAVAGLSNRLEDLAEAIGTMNEASSFASYAANLDSEDQFTVVTDSEAVPGVYDIMVNSLAENEVEVSQGFVDKTTNTMAQGTLSVTVAGVQTDVVIDGTNNTLVDMAAAIDGVDGVSAYVLDTGEPANPYKLVVQGDDTGLANGISFDTTGLAGGDIPVFTEQRPAADAHLTVNGIDVYSDSNHVTETLPGVDIDLLNTGVSAARLSISADPEALADKVQTFVDAYNDVVSYFEKETVFNAELGVEGGLVSDSSARRVMDGIATSIGGVYAVGTDLEALSQLGISTERDGMLAFDRDAFKAALEDYPDDVEALWTDPGGPLNDLKTRIEDVYVDEDSGVLQSRKDGLEEQIEELTLSIEAYDVRIASRGASLRKQFTAMEVALAQMQSTGAYLAAMFATPGGQQQ